jgi:competence protein ComEC
MFRQVFRSNIFVKVLSAYVVGLLLAQSIEGIAIQRITQVLLLAMPLLLLCYALLYLQRRYSTYKIMQAVLLYACITLAAILNHLSQRVMLQASYQELLQKDSLEISCGGTWQSSGKRFKGVARLHAREKEYSIIVWTKDIQAFEKARTFSCANTLRRIPPALNPGDFDRRNYLARKGIFHEISIDSASVEPSKYRPKAAILQYSEQASRFILQRLDSAIKDSSLFNMCAALLIGYRADLDPDLLRVYANSGTIHIISVSGLHVGIVFLVFSWILTYVFRFRQGFLNAILLISFVWFYALLTGLPPSVVRAAAMISLGIWAKLRRFKDRGLNLLAFSALASLVWQPGLLYDIGFQLSYCAVTGIVLFYKGLQSLWYPDSKVLILIRDTFAVSIAAQIGALPLCLLHFQQFPNYFLLGNLIAIPLSTIALYGSMALLLFSDFSLLHQAIVWILEQSISLMNFSLQWIANLPGAVWELPLNLWQVLALTIIIIAIYCYIAWDMRSAVNIALLSIAVMLGSGIMEHHQITKRKNIQVLQHYKYPMYLVEQGTQHQLIVDINVPHRQLQIMIDKLHRIQKRPQKVYFTRTANFSMSIAGKQIESKRILPKNALNYSTANKGSYQIDL